MDALEAIFTRRSVRQYTDEAVSEEMLETMLKAAMSAPSANNRQPWQFIVIDERDILNEIPKLHPYSKMLRQAPLAIPFSGETRTSPSYRVQDCAAATQNILLAARALGLGAVWLGIYPREIRVDGLREMLSLPDEISPMALISIGHPAVKQGPVERYDKKRIHRNGW